MKIICISDTHCQHEALNDLLPPGDMIIHAGDISMIGCHEDIQDFVDWFSTLPYKHKVFIAGNHDFALETQKHLIRFPKNIVYLENQVVGIEGYILWGSPVCPPFYNWAFMWSLEHRRKLYEQIPDKCDIIISHSPPYTMLDKIKTGRNVGCQLLKAKVDEIKPKLVVCGHSHENYGTLTTDTSIIVNASIMTLQYKPLNKPILVNLK